MKSKTKTSLLIGFTALILSSASLVHAVTIEIRGGASCGQWTESRLQDWAAIGNQRWLVGYLSGLAAAYRKDILRGTDNPSIFLWMDNYCRANPLKRIDNGGDLLYRELVRQKNL